MVADEVVGASGRPAAWTRPLTTPAPASAAADPRMPLRESMIDLRLEYQWAAASPVVATALLIEPAVSPAGPVPVTATARLVLASQKSRWASMAAVVAPIRCRASA